jgi:hypothetical protein
MASASVAGALRIGRLGSHFYSPVYILPTAQLKGGNMKYLIAPILILGLTTGAVAHPDHNKCHRHADGIHHCK